MCSMFRYLFTLLIVAAPLAGTARSEEKSPPPPGLDLRVYHIGTASPETSRSSGS